MKTEAQIDGSNLTVAVVGNDGKDTYCRVTFDVREAWSALSPEHRRDMVALLLMDDELLRGTLERLTGEADCWSGDDSRTREQWLLAIKEIHTGDVEFARHSRSEAWAEKHAVEAQASRLRSEVYEHIRDVAAVPECCRIAISRLGDADMKQPREVPKHEASPCADGCTTEEA